MKGKVNIRIHGKIVEIMDQNGKQTLRILCSGCCFIINLEDFSGLKLGNKISFSCNFPISELLLVP